MSLEFVENVILYIPDVKSSYKAFTEAQSNNRLIVEIAAIHAGLTSNFRRYPANELEASLATWTQPYPRPIITNHDVYTDPLGRVMAARMSAEPDGTPFVMLQAAISGSDAMQKIMDQRYMTGSVGGSAGVAKCSVCETDWAAPSDKQGLPCKHQMGKVYNGKLACLELADLSFREYSFVNVPADKLSGLRSQQLQTSESEDDEYINPVAFYSLSMDKESILSLSESEEPLDVLDSMKKKQAHSTYMNIKGTFLSVSSYEDPEKNNEELNEKFTFMKSYTTMDKEPNENSEQKNIHEQLNPTEESNMKEKDASEEVEDILSITEQLSADLASTSDDESVVEEATDQDETSEELSEDSDVEASSEVTSDDSEATDDSANESEKVEESTDQQLVETEIETNELAEDNKDDEDIDNDALVSENEALKEENKKLKRSLHLMLAERVVDTKIAVGIVEHDQRAEALNEHAARSASSLADSLRDLEQYARNHVKESPLTGAKLELGVQAMATGSSVDAKEAFTGEESTISVPVQTAEDVLVDVLMGRKAL